MTTNYTNIFHYKTLQNFPKLGFWFENKGNIWQPWSGREGFRHLRAFRLQTVLRRDLRRGAWWGIYTIRQILVKIVSYDTFRWRTTLNRIDIICEKCVEQHFRCRTTLNRIALICEKCVVWHFQMSYNIK
jgi:hypothetical protein